MSRKQERQRHARQMKKEIEAILHPCPKIGDVDILHTHLKNREISFTAWRGNDPVEGGKHFNVHRSHILARPDFYTLYGKDLLGLAAGKEEEKDVSTKEG